jgi:hypothetical protein
MMKHYERKVNDEGEHIKYGNQEIDTSMSHLNYNLAPSRKSQFGYLQERLKEVHVLNRKDVKVMADWAITIPKDLPKEKERDFFVQSYNFLADRYGEENVISSYVHRDETTPHMHFSFIPVVFDDKKERWKVSAKERLNRLELQKFHGDLSEHMEKHFGYDVGVLNEATKEGNKSIAELKRGTAQERLKSLENQIKGFEEYKTMLNEQRAKMSEISQWKGDFINEAGMVKIERTKLNQLREFATGYLMVEENKPLVKKLKMENDALKKSFEKFVNKHPEMEDEIIAALQQSLKENAKNKKKQKKKSR